MFFTHQMKRLLSYSRVIFALTLVFIAGCQPRHSQQEPETHHLTGVVMSIDKEHNLLVVKHDAVPGKMEAMTMPFSLADPAILNTLRKGDEIEGEMSVTANGAVLDHIKVLSEKSN